MARRSSELGHITCLCGHICPVLSCRCTNAQAQGLERKCNWCRWWDTHEPHDTPAYKPDLAAIGDFLVALNNGTLNAKHEQ